MPFLLNVTHYKRQCFRLSHILRIGDAQRFLDRVGFCVIFLVRDGIALRDRVCVLQRLGVVKPFIVTLRLGLSNFFCVRVRVVFGDHLP